MTALSAIPSPAATAPRDRTERSTYPLARLCPVVPLVGGLPIHSWLGGTPHMPPETPWPMAGGKPALFLAQISCADLPTRLWGKRGPRAGWLLAFTPQDRPGEPILRHIDRFGDAQQPPGPLHYPTTPPMRDDILDLATGAPGAIPRWPIEITTGTAPAAPAGIAPDPVDLDDPRFHPFDWGSLFVLLETLHSEVDWQHRVVAALLDPRAPDVAALRYLDSLANARTALAALRAELRAARDGGLAFSPALCALALRGLASLSLEPPARARGLGPATRPAPLLENAHLRECYGRWFDHYARHLYTERPEDLPDPQRTLFEDRWSRRAQSECGEMGGPPHGPDGAREITVLRLPTSHLMGWSFGPSDDFHVTLPLARLEAGALDIGGEMPPAA